MEWKRYYIREQVTRADLRGGVSPAPPCWDPSCPEPTILARPRVHCGRVRSISTISSSTSLLGQREGPHSSTISDTRGVLASSALNRAPPSMRRLPA
ncbi:hypothetical protein Pcinc_043490 [Petrolisthes cinctipes]|uniref:Uncharacterized protein n=1 Tax=Petrolisthes cinctipes TaxID=88211 RepID=A0AAE1BIP4_PETCI|nr:hypothetical protein Pcinc_043490 [Petrolisthes cinctipes]